MLNKNVEVFMACEKEAHEADIVLFGAPFDSTTSYRPGTRFGSSAIRRESYGIECYSPYQDKDLEDTKVMDCGDLELCFGNTKKALAQIEEQAKEILDNSAIPFMLGGEHLVTLGAFRAVLEKYPDIHIIHFDAHADLREEYLGEQLSHASVIRRCWDLVGDERIYQFGIRSGDREEFYWAKEHVTMKKFDFEGLEEVLEKLEGMPIYFTLDLDVLDPSVFPGTGTPEAGGVTFVELMNAVIQTAQGVNVVGCDVNELSPVYDPSGVSTAVAGKIIREFLLALQV